MLLLFRTGGTDHYYRNIRWVWRPTAAAFRMFSFSNEDVMSPRSGGGSNGIFRQHPARTNNERACDADTDTMNQTVVFLLPEAVGGAVPL